MNYALIGAAWGHEALRRSGIDCRVLETPRELPVYTPRYVFCLNWSQMVPAWFTEAHTVVNFHCTALPYGRGGHPIENLIREGKTETVITAHRMTNELDVGPIYGTRGPISLAGTKAQIQERFIEPVADLMRWIVETEPEPVPQVGEPTYFKRLPQAEYEALWRTRS